MGERTEREMEAGKFLQSEKEGEVEEKVQRLKLKELLKKSTMKKRGVRKRPQNLIQQPRELSSIFVDSQEAAIVEFIKQQPELFDKEHERFHDRHRTEALWSEISEELNLGPIDVKRWFESQRTRYGKLAKKQSEQAPKELTRRQSWIHEQMGFLKTHIRRKGANRSLGFGTSTTRQHDDSRGSTTDGDSLESSVCTRQSTLPLQAATSVSTDTRILEHFEEMQALLTGFIQQKPTSDRQPFYDYVASEADKMSPEEYEKFKVQVFNAIQNVKSTSRRQSLPRRSATITTESQRVGILPQAAQQPTNSQTSAATICSYSV